MRRRVAVPGSNSWYRALRWCTTAPPKRGVRVTQRVDDAAALPVPVVVDHFGEREELGDEFVGDEFLGIVGSDQSEEVTHQLCVLGR